LSFGIPHDWQQKPNGKSNMQNMHFAFPDNPAISVVALSATTQGNNP